MRRDLPPLSFVLLLLVGFGLAPLVATAAEEVEVSAVRFNHVRAPNGGTDPWLEADVVLTVRPANATTTDAPRSAGPRMVSRVRVAILIGFELPGGAAGERRLEHYWAEAECVALEAGRADVRFYLPPELVKRDQLHGDPKYWGIEIAIAGRALPAGRAAYASALSAADARKVFQAQGAAAAAVNDGLLQPQYLTPFAQEYGRSTPSFVRRDVR